MTGETTEEHELTQQANGTVNPAYDDAARENSDRKQSLVSIMQIIVCDIFTEKCIVNSSLHSERMTFSMFNDGLSKALINVMFYMIKSMLQSRRCMAMYSQLTLYKKSFYVDLLGTSSTY